MKDKPEKQRNIQVTKEIKYLGIIISDQKKCFITQKKTNNAKSKEDGKHDLHCNIPEC